MFTFYGKMPKKIQVAKKCYFCFKNNKNGKFATFSLPILKQKNKTRA